MSEHSTSAIWFTCPKCRSRQQALRDHTTAKLRCAQCGAVLKLNATSKAASPAPTENVSPNELSSPSNSSAADDELKLAPIEPYNPPRRVLEDVDDGVEYNLAPVAKPSSLQRPPAAPPKSKSGPPPLPEAYAPAPQAAVESSNPQTATDSPSNYSHKPPPPDDVDKHAEYVVKPPKGAGILWAYTSGVYAFPFSLHAVVPWMVGSIGMVLGTLVAMKAYEMLQTGSQFGALATGCFGIIAFFIFFYTFSYIAACVFDIVVNATYNIDKAQDWPDPDWRERVWHLLRLGYLLVVSGTIAAPIAGMAATADPELFPLVYVSALFLVFPFLLLSALEADSIFLPVSGPIAASLFRSWFPWLVFYLLTGLMTFGCDYAITKAFMYSHELATFVGGPFWVTMVFIDCRLLGRLTWLILRKHSASHSPKTAKRDRDYDLKKSTVDSMMGEFLHA